MFTAKCEIQIVFYSSLLTFYSTWDILCKSFRVLSRRPLFIREYWFFFLPSILLFFHSWIQSNFYFWLLSKSPAPFWSQNSFIIHVFILKFKRLQIKFSFSICGLWEEQKVQCNSVSYFSIVYISSERTLNFSYWNLLKNRI